MRGRARALPAPRAAAAITALAVGLGLAPGCATAPARPRPEPSDGARSAADDPAASFARAEALYHEGRLAEARALLAALAERPDLVRPDRVRALADLGVVEAEEGQLEPAERSLRRALELPGDDAARPWVGKARFYLGELARTRFDAAPLDPAGVDTDELARQLDTKASLLLAAQDLYLSAIAAGDAAWGVAAGSRIGELYEELRRELVDAPLPPGLEAGAADAYRGALRQRVRVLVQKAVDVYEETLRVARERGVESAFVPRMEDGLRRMRQVLDETPP